MSTLAWIIFSGIVMALFALSGAFTMLLSEERLKRLVLPLVALSAGSLIGGALLHMLPAAAERMDAEAAHGWATIGFVSFFGLEQLLHWHHGKDDSHGHHHHPLTVLVLLGDGLHKLVGGMAVGAAFTVSTRVGLMTWLAAAAHEIPHELGDFGALVHGGLAPRRALLLNLLSALPFLVGGLVSYLVAQFVSLDLTFLVAFAAGNFIYLGAVDLMPELNRPHRRDTVLWHVFCIAVGGGLLAILGLVLPAHH
ncbi:MAG: ZIP family metal transporter [Myxococcales bacterium]